MMMTSQFCYGYLVNIIGRLSGILSLSVILSDMALFRISPIEFGVQLKKGLHCIGNWHDKRLEPDFEKRGQNLAVLYQAWVARFSKLLKRSVIMGCKMDCINIVIEYLKTNGFDGLQSGKRSMRRKEKESQYEKI